MSAIDDSNNFREVRNPQKRGLLLPYGLKVSWEVNELPYHVWYVRAALVVFNTLLIGDCVGLQVITCALLHFSCCQKKCH